MGLQADVPYHAGLIGAGTNNARLAGMLRGLSSYYYKEPTLLFLVRVAQGLVHMGKGLLNLAPKHADGNLLSGALLDEHHVTLLSAGTVPLLICTSRQACGWQRLLMCARRG